MLELILKTKNTLQAVFLAMSLMMTVNISFAEGSEKQQVGQVNPIEKNAQELEINPDIPEGEMTAGLKEYYEKYKDYYLEFPLYEIVKNNEQDLFNYGYKEIHQIEILNGMVIEVVKHRHQDMDVFYDKYEFPKDGEYEEFTNSGSKIKFLVEKGILKDFKIIEKGFLQENMERDIVKYFLQHEKKASKCDLFINLSKYKVLEDKKGFDSILQRGEIMVNNYPEAVVMFKINDKDTIILYDQFYKIKDGEYKIIFNRSSELEKNKIIKIKNCTVQL